MMRYLVAGFLFSQAFVCAAEKPRITVSKETTFVTEPVNEDGFVDLTTAINQRMSAGITTENNAAAVIFPAVGPAPDGSVLSERFFAALGVPVPPKEGDYFDMLEEYLVEQGVKKSSLEMQAIVKNRDIAMNRPWSRDEFPKIADWLDSEAKPLDIIVKGIQRESYFSPVNSRELSETTGQALLATQLPHLQISRGVAYALICRAMLDTGEGRKEAAWDELLAVYRFGRHVRHCSSVIESMVGIAIEATSNRSMLRFIEETQPDNDLALRYIEDLESLPRRVPVVQSVDFGERLIYVDIIVMVAYNNREGLICIQDGLPELGQFFANNSKLKVDWDQVFRDFNSWHDRVVAAMKLESYSARTNALMKIDGEASRKFQQGRFSNLLLRLSSFANDEKVTTKYVSDVLFANIFIGMNSMSVVDDHSQQRFDNLRVALALVAYHSDHKGYPDKLEQLAPQYLPKIPQDLFGEKPLTYRRVDGGYLLYSVGENQKDDGGKSFDAGKDDLVVRVPSK